MSTLRFIPRAAAVAALLAGTLPPSAQRPKAFANGDAKAPYFPEEEDSAAAYLNLDCYRFAP